MGMMDGTCWMCIVGIVLGSLLVIVLIALGVVATVVLWRQFGHRRQDDIDDSTGR